MKRDPGLDTSPHCFRSAHLCLLLVGFAASVLPLRKAQADTILVPAEQPTIQAGIDAATPGDTVVVAPGSYSGVGNEDIDFGGKGIVLRAEQGPDVTTIQGPDADPFLEPDPRAFQFISGETSAAVLEGFTIRDFHVLEPEVGLDGGGAIYIDQGAAPTIRECAFLDNYFIDGTGGAISAWGGLIEDCTFVGNAADAWNDSGSGGAISLSNGTIRRCLIRANWAAESQFGPGAGGGVSLGSGTSIEDCVIVENVATHGGGVHVTAAGTGMPTEIWIAGTTIASNESYGDGSQLYFASATPVSGQRLYLTTSVVWSTGDCGNSDVQTFEEFPGVARLTFLCSVVDRSSVAGPMQVVYDPHSIEDDPLFCEPRICGDSGAGDYALQPESPCLPDSSPCGALIGAIGEVCGASSLPETEHAIVGLLLEPPRPNPARIEARFPLSLESATHVRATIFDAGGRRVAGLTDGTMAAGFHELSWNLADDAGRRVPTGVYNLQVVVPSGAGSVRLTVLE